MDHLGRDLVDALAERDKARKELEELRRTVLLDCQPKSQQDAVYVSVKWLDRILLLANGPVTPNLKRTPR